MAWSSPDDPYRWRIDPAATAWWLAARPARYNREGERVGGTIHVDGHDRPDIGCPADLRVRRYVGDGGLRLPERGLRVLGRAHGPTRSRSSPVLVDRDKGQAQSVAAVGRRARPMAVDLGWSPSRTDRWLVPHGLRHVVTRQGGEGQMTKIDAGRVFPWPLGNDSALTEGANGVGLVVLGLASSSQGQCGRSGIEGDRETGQSAWFLTRARPRRKQGETVHGGRRWCPRPADYRSSIPPSFSFPVWSPDGTEILISRTRSAGPFGELLPPVPSGDRRCGTVRILRLLPMSHDRPTSIVRVDTGRNEDPVRLRRFHSRDLSVDASDGGDRIRLTTSPYGRDAKEVPTDMSLNGNRFLYPYRIEPGPTDRLSRRRCS